MPPQVTVRIPVPGTTLNFATRAMRRKGMGAIFSQQRVALPGPNVFVRPKGLGAFPRKGVGVFTMPGPACIPPNIFAQYAYPNAARPSASKCQSCAKPCSKRRGLGDPLNDNSTDPSLQLGSTYDPTLQSNGSYSILDQPSATASVPSAPVSTSLSLYDPSQQVTSAMPTLDVYSASLTPAQNQVINQLAQSGANVAPTAAALTTSNTAQIAANSGYTTAQIAAINAGVTAGTITAAQAAQAIAAGPAAATSTFSLSTWLTQSTLLTGFQNGSVVFGGAALAVLVSALASSKKKGKK